jgi:ABC-type Fe3+-citrate transport system substrate-binding protein
MTTTTNPTKTMRSTPLKMNSTITPRRHTRPSAPCRRHRRRVTVGLLSLSILASACGNDPTAGDTVPPAETRRLVALDEFSGLAALSVGVTPVQIDTVFGYTTASDVFNHLGVTTGTAGTDGVDLEAVAALTPTDIIGVSIPTTASAEPNLDEIAPTTVIEYTATWQDQLRTVGEALGRVDEAEDVIARVEASISTLKTDIQLRAWTAPRSRSSGTATVCSRSAAPGQSDRCSANSASAGQHLKTSTPNRPTPSS